MKPSRLVQLVLSQYDPEELLFLLLLLQFYSNQILHLPCYHLV
jgi:hypothetical protein